MAVVIAVYQMVEMVALVAVMVSAVVHKVAQGHQVRALLAGLITLALVLMVLAVAGEPPLLAQMDHLHQAVLVGQGFHLL